MNIKYVNVHKFTVVDFEEMDEDNENSKLDSIPTEIRIWYLLRVTVTPPCSVLVWCIVSGVTSCEECSIHFRSDYLVVLLVLV
jgi:hypothetical protein